MSVLHNFNKSKRSISVSKLQIFSCPSCSEGLEIQEASELSLHCIKCDRAIPKTLGFLDFIWPEKNLPAAAKGTIDLQSDQRIAEELVRVFHEMSFDTLSREYAKLEKMEQPSTDPLSEFQKQIIERAERRFNRFYDGILRSVGFEHGKALVNKVEPVLDRFGVFGLKGDLALEAGGGHGMFLEEFSKRYEHVVFLDCSLAFLVLAKKLCEERQVENVILIRGDLTNLPFQSGSFDLIHQNGVIEHVYDPKKMVEEAVRVTSSKGVYVCLSPNKYPITLEPHFRLPLFGFIPKFIRRWLILYARGVTTEEGTDLRSLWQLHGYFRQAKPKRYYVYFLPSKLLPPVYKTPVSRLIYLLFNMRIVGPFISFALNRLFLFVMPYHIVICQNFKKVPGPIK